MKFSIRNGWLQSVRHLASPNCDERPAGVVPSLIIVHGISLPPGEYGGPYIDQLFTNTLDPRSHPYFAEIQGLKVSSHVLIRRNGECTQYVSFAQRAWHAGKSCYQGREACNDFSIGIELEGVDDQPYEVVQYEVLAAMVQALSETYPEVNPAAIVGHCHVAPGRKTDPGSAFEWPRLASLLSSTSMA